jgi:transcriptional regulator with XRE-family HTH domain
MTSNASSFDDELMTLPDVGRRFQVLRKASGRTQTEVAQAVGIRQEALSRFESGRGNDFSLAKLLRLLEVLAVRMEFVPATRRPSLADVLKEVRAGTNTGPGAR